MITGASPNPHIIGGEGDDDKQLISPGKLRQNHVRRRVLHGRRKEVSVNGRRKEVIVNGRRKEVKMLMDGYRRKEVKMLMAVIKR